jgi:hypothetical protein
MKTMEDYTPEIQAKIPEYISRAKDDLYSGKEAAGWKKENTVKYVNKVYSFAEKQLPAVIVADNPEEYKIFYNLIFHFERPEIIPMIEKVFNEKNSNGSSELEYEIEAVLRSLSFDRSEFVQSKSDYLFITSEYARAYLMWYRFIHKEFEIPFSKSDDLEWFYQNVNAASMSRCYFTDKACLVLRMPCKILRNEVGFHSATEPAIQFVGGYGAYYLNGRHVPNWVFEDYEKGELTFDKFLAQDNEDIKAGIITLIKEREDNEGLLKFLNAYVVDEQKVVHENGYSETLTLYKTREVYPFLVDENGNQNQPYAWLRMVCPSTGQVYLIDTSASFNDAVECAKWHRPKGVPSSVPYTWQSAN